MASSSVTRQELLACLANYLGQWIQNRWVADPDDGYLILDKAGPTGQCLGFAQTGLFDGYFVVEIRIDKNDSDFGFWKAGTKELAHGIVSEAKAGRFQTFTNEAFRKEVVKAVFQHFYEHFGLHPDFEWRSIKEDLEARQSQKGEKTLVAARERLHK